MDTSRGLGDELAGVRVPVYAGLGLALGFASLYAGYRHPVSVDGGLVPAALAGPAGETLLALLGVGVLASVVQAVHRGGPLLSWFLLAAPTLGGVFGLTAGAGAVDLGVDPVIALLYGVASTGTSVFAALGVLLVADVAWYAARGRWPVDLPRAFGTYSYLFFGVCLLYLVGILVVLLVA